MKLTTLIAIGLTTLSVAGLSLSGAAITWKASNASEEALRTAAEEKLTIIRDLQKDNIENYFETVKGQIVTYSNNEMVIYAMKAFRKGFADHRDETASTSIAKERKALGNYYSEEYAREFSARNPGEHIETDSLLSQLDAESVDMQYRYIQKNRYPLGEKHKLDSIGDGSSYDRVHKNLHPKIRQYLEEFGYYDIFLVEPESGKIVYTVFKELDFATSLKDGPYAHTGIGDVFRKANQATTPDAFFISDLAPYAPSYQDPAAFIASPIFNGDRKVGVLIFQLPVDKLNSIMTNHQRWSEAGLGNSGESYLVGADGTMRTNSRMMVEAPERLKEKLEQQGLGTEQIRIMLAKKTTIGMLAIETEAVQAAIQGKSGIIETVSYHGNSVLSAYTPIDVPGEQWGIIAEITLDEALAPATTLTHDIVKAAGITILILGLLSVLTGRLVASWLSTPVAKAANIAKRIAEGKLNNPPLDISGSDEIRVLGQSLTTMSNTLYQIMQQIHKGATDLDNSAREVAATSDALAKNTEEQASSVEQTAATITELASIANNNVEAANNTNNVAEQIHSGAQKGHQAMLSLMTSMEEINESSTQILDIVHVVEDIAFQTNLLALNAAVEAARAGDQGRGFAVVATEVRNLAQRSATAVQKIDALAKESNGRVGQGREHAEIMQRIIECFIKNTDEVIDMVSSIKSASDEQAKAISTLNQALQYIDRATQQNAASVEETSVTSHQLSQLASELQKQITFFEFGETASPAQSAKAAGSPAGEVSHQPHPIDTHRSQLSRPSRVSEPA